MNMPKKLSGLRLPPFWLRLPHTGPGLSGGA